MYEQTASALSVDSFLCLPFCRVDGASGIAEAERKPPSHADNEEKKGYMYVGSKRGKVGMIRNKRPSLAGDEAMMTRRR